MTMILLLPIRKSLLPPTRSPYLHPRSSYGFWIRYRLLHIQMADYFSTSIDYLIGYTAISHKIEPVTDSMLNESESAVLDKYRMLPAHKKEIINIIINSYLED